MLSITVLLDSLRHDEEELANALGEIDSLLEEIARLEKNSEIKDRLIALFEKLVAEKDSVGAGFNRRSRNYGSSWPNRPRRFPEFETGRKMDRQGKHPGGGGGGRTRPEYDETGIHVKGRLHWVHTACNMLFTYMRVELLKYTYSIYMRLAVLRTLRLLSALSIIQNIRGEG